jgi:hypothetical protein
MSATNTNLDAKRAIAGQRNIVILVLSDAAPGKEHQFKTWYGGQFRSAIERLPTVVKTRLYEQDAVDLTLGRFAPPPMRYLTVVEISASGAEEAKQPIEEITRQHADGAVAAAPATWTYYPCSEKFGLRREHDSSRLTVHYANPIPGRESEFREAFASQLVRHAIWFNPLISGQCFERTLYQSPGALEPIYQTIGLYEQDGPSEVLVKSFKAPPPDVAPVTSLDTTRFTEAAYLLLD